MSKRAKFAKIALNYGVTFVILITALYVEEIRQLHPSIQLLLVLLFPAVQLLTSNAFDYLREKTANIRLEAQAR